MVVAPLQVTYSIYIVIPRADFAPNKPEPCSNEKVCQINITFLNTSNFCQIERNITNKHLSPHENKVNLQSI